MRKYIVLTLLLTSACSTPLPCVFNDTPECEARWRPVMQQQMQGPVYPFPQPYAVAPPPATLAPTSPGTICRPQSAGHDTWLVCQ
jgi:hypothetical protein